ncbi:hypothetical protein LCGC14_1853470, partial [marine sediment metagenome]
LKKFISLNDIRYILDYYRHVIINRSKGLAARQFIRRCHILSVGIPILK